MPTMTSIPNRCLIYGTGNQVALVTKQLRPSKTNVLVRVHAAGLNPVDAKQVIGDKLPPALQGFSRQITKGRTIGFDFSGTVIRSSCDGSYKEGDAVFGTMPALSGTLCDYIDAPIHQLSHKPTILSFIEAASIPLVGLTALQALEPYERICKSIAVIGASGGTGHVVIQIAKCLGFSTIIAIASQRNRDFCKSMGATHVLDYHNNDRLAEEIQQIVKGDQVDIIFDCVTSVDRRDAAHTYPIKLKNLYRERYLRLGGRTSDWFRAGWEKVLPYSWDCFGKEKLFWIRFSRTSGELERLKQWCDAGQLRPYVGEEINFTEEGVQKAFDDIMSRRVKGKLVVKVRDDS